MWERAVRVVEEDSVGRSHKKKKGMHGPTRPEVRAFRTRRSSAGRVWQYQPVTAGRAKYKRFVVNTSEVIACHVALLADGAAAAYLTHGD